jgi:isopentenyl-diphosphate delta-isomerase type 1
VSAGAGGEPVDVVDEHDRVLRVVSRAEMRRQRLLHRAVSIAVFGNDGRLLVHRRAATKDIWPSYWDIAAGGVVGSGEGYHEAAERELAEELGVVGVPLQHLGGGRYCDASVDEIAHFYRCVSDGPFVFADGEVDEVRWVDAADLAALMASEPFTPDSLALLLPLLTPFP